MLAGAGHGGVEAIILGSLVLYVFLQMAALGGADLSKIVPADQLALAQQQVAAYWSTPWYAALLGAVERLFTLAIQVSCSVLVLQAFTRGQWFWVGLAVLYHAAVDASAVLAVPILGPYWTEVIVALFALLSLAIIFALRRPEPLPPRPGPLPAVTALEPALKPVAETPEQLDNSRFI